MTKRVTATQALKNLQVANLVDVITPLHKQRDAKNFEEKLTDELQGLSLDTLEALITVVEKLEIAMDDALSASMAAARA